MNTIYKHFRFKRKFGVEIEVSNTVKKNTIIEAIRNFSNYNVRSLGYGKSINNKQWHVKKDGTCGEEYGEDGWEVASFVGHTPQDVIHIGDIATTLKLCGATVNNNCGLHIHVEVPDFSIKQMGILLANWVKIEKIIGYIVSPERLHDYCWPLVPCLIDLVGKNYAKKHYTPEYLYKILTPGYNDDPVEWRYHSLNIVNYYNCARDRRRKRKTIELRYPESSLDRDNIVGWIRLFINFIENAKVSHMPDNLEQVDLKTALNLMGLHHQSDKFYIFNAALNKTRMWALKRIINNINTVDYCDNFELNLGYQAKKLLNDIKV